MSIGLLVVDCILNNSHSLKEKRSIFQSITKKIRQNFNVSIAETNYHDLWQRAELSVVFVNTDWKMIERNFQRILEFIEQDRRITILNHETKSIY